MSNSLDKIQLRLKLVFYLEEFIRDIFAKEKPYTSDQLIEALYNELKQESDIVRNLWKLTQFTQVERAYSCEMRTKYCLNVFENEVNYNSIEEGVNYCLDMYFLEQEAEGNTEKCLDFLDLHIAIIKEGKPPIQYPIKIPWRK